MWFADAHEDCVRVAVQHVVVVGQRVALAGIDLGRRQKVYVFFVDRAREVTVERVGMGIANCEPLLEPGVGLKEVGKPMTKSGWRITTSRDTR